MANIYGIDIGSDCIKIAVVEKKLRGYEVVKLGRRLLDDNSPEEISAKLKDLINSLGYDSDDDHAVALFHGKHLSHRKLSLPLKRRRQITEALPYAIEAVTPFGAEKIVADFTPIKENENGTTLLALFTSKQEFSTFHGTLAEAEIFPTAVIPSPVATYASLTDEKLSDIPLTAIIDMEEETAVITLLENGIPCTFHAVLTGDTTAEKLSAEVSRLCISYGGEDLRPDLVITCGDISGGEALEKSLADNLNCTVSKAEPEGGDVSVDDDERATAHSPSIFATSIGGAIRHAQGRAFSEIDLTPEGSSFKKRASDDRPQFVTTLFLLGIAILLGAGSYIADWISLDRKYNSLKEEIRAEFKRVLPEITKIVSEKQQLKNALLEINKKTSALGTSVMETEPFLKYLHDISKAASPDMTLDIDELTYEWGKIEMSGRVPSFENIEELRKNLERLPWTAKVRIDKAKASAGTGDINFRFEMETQL